MPLLGKSRLRIASSHRRTFEMKFLTLPKDSWAESSTRPRGRPQHLPQSITKYETPHSKPRRCVENDALLETRDGANCLWIVVPNDRGLTVLRPWHQRRRGHALSTPLGRRCRFHRAGAHRESPMGFSLIENKAYWLSAHGDGSIHRAPGCGTHPPNLGTRHPGSAAERTPRYAPTLAGAQLPTRPLGPSPSPAQPVATFGAHGREFRTAKTPRR
jgi:hypothetical protein